jgi:hypothetical protein
MSYNKQPIPSLNRNFKKLCYPIFGNHIITRLDISNIYKNLQLVDENSCIYSLKYKFSTIEDLIKYISSELSKIYNDIQCNHNEQVWEIINTRFEIYGNPFNYKAYLEKLEINYIFYSKYFLVNNIYNQDNQDHLDHNCKISNRELDKISLFDKKERKNYLKLVQNNSESGLILSDKQILRHSKMPKQKKIIRKILNRSVKQKINVSHYLEQ